MKNCTLTSTQDTLFLGPLPPDLVERYEGFLPDELRRDGDMRQIFENCRIEGTVDFIFGCGNTLFTDCRIHSRDDARNMGYVAAPAHSKSQKQGFRFENCQLTCDEGVAEGSIYLARPWRDYGMVRFQNCACGPHIASLGFDKWSGTDRDRTARFFETPAPAGRVAWINKTEMAGNTE
jgi:pectinesterase